MAAGRDQWAERSVAKRIDEFFFITERGSNIRTEVLAGVSTFLVLSYIFVVNPAILADAGMDRNAVLLATILASGLATIAMGLWARLPFVLAPGMEMNAYVAYLAVGVVGLTWQEALGAVFWSGILFVVMTATGLRHKIIDSIPERMQGSLSLAVGVFLALVACKISGVLTFDGVRVSGFGSTNSVGAWVLYITSGSAIVLDRLKVRAAVLLSVAIGTTAGWVLGVPAQDGVAGIGAGALATMGEFDLGVVLNPRALSVILVLFLVDFYGSVAKIIGISARTSIQKDGLVPRLQKALYVDSVGTSAASALGTTNITVYVESGVGVGAGGRTGLVAVVCGLLMLACLTITPLISLIPLEATTGALILVAIKLMPPRTELCRYKLCDAIAIVFMQMAVVATFALDRAILVGLLVYVVAAVLGGRWPNGYMLLSVVALGAGAVMQGMQ